MIFYFLYIPSPNSLLISRDLYLPIQRRILGEGLRGAQDPIFTFLYNLNPSNRPLSVVIIVQSGFNFIQFRAPLSEFSGTATAISFLIRKSNSIRRTTDFVFKEPSS